MNWGLWGKPFGFGKFGKFPFAKAPFAKGFGKFGKAPWFWGI